jgi:hypothetical protein
VAATRTRRDRLRPRSRVVLVLTLVVVQVAQAEAARMPATPPVAADRVVPRLTPTKAAQVAPVASSSPTPDMAKKVKVAMLDGSCVWVDTKDAAALTGAEGLPYGTKEFARAIYQRPDGKFCWSEAIPGTRDDFTFATDPKAGKFAGILHSHHGDEEGTFSPTDLRVANGLDRTSYIRANKSGEVRRYEPGDRPEHASRIGDSIAGGIKTVGTLIGKLTRREQIEAAYDLHNPEAKK